MTKKVRDMAATQERKVVMKRLSVLELPMAKPLKPKNSLLKGEAEEGKSRGNNLELRGTKR